MPSGVRGVTRKKVTRMEDMLLAKVLDSIADELKMSRSRLNDTLESSGLVEILKAGEATIPFSEYVEAGVAGTASAHAEQERRTEATRRAWQPKDNFAEFAYGQHSIIGDHAKPSFTREGVTIDSRYPQDSIYKAAARAVRKGVITRGDIGAVLGISGAFEEEIENVLKSFDKTLDALDSVDKTLVDIAKKQEAWEVGFDRTLRKHRRILGYED